MNQDFLPEGQIEPLTAQVNPRQQLFGEVEQLNLVIAQMSRRLETLQQEKNDLEILLQAATEHSDHLLRDLQRQKGDLKILLEATTEHSDCLALELKHQAQEERRQREEQFQLITEATPVGLAITELTSSQFLYVNEQMGALLGLSAQALLKCQASEFYMNVSDRQQAISALTSQGQFQGEVQFRRADGTLFWGLLSLRPFLFQGANTLLTALYDIDARKQAEEALRMAEAKYRGIAVQRDIDLDQELQANGTANLLAGLCGGIVGYTSVNRTLLNYKAGATYPLSAFVIAGTCGAVLLFGSTFLSYFPKSIFGGLLLYLGLSLLVEWIYSAWFKLSRLDYGLVIGILIIIAGWNFLAGVGAGVVISCFIFIFNYSRNPVIKYTLSGALHQSNVGRSPQQQRLLHREGDQIYILTLQGFIFFGTANTLLEQVRQRLQDSNLSELRFLVLDFRLVNGLDSSAVLSFVKIKQLAQKQDFYLVFTALQPIIQQQLKLGECLEPQDTVCQVFPDFDRGIEWCENQILEAVPWRRRQSLPLALQLDEWFPNTDYIAELMHYLEEIDVEAGQFLFRQGEQADSLFIIESGQVSILRTRDSHQDLRVQTIGSGSLVGEMDMFLKQPHPMSAKADVSSTVYCLSSKALSRMQREAPQAAIAFQEAINSLLAERLSQTYQEIDRLLH